MHRESEKEEAIKYKDLKESERDSQEKVKERDTYIKRELDKDVKERDSEREMERTRETK